MQRLFSWKLITLVLMVTSLRAHAEDAGSTGTLRLAQLPFQARVYVDGKPAHVLLELLTLPPGRHDIQIEHLSAKGGVLAAHRQMEIEPGKTLAVYARLFPVTLAPWSPRHAVTEQPVEVLYAPPGPAGPEGPPGEAGSPYKGFEKEPTDEAVLQTLKAALTLRLDSLAAQAEDAEFATLMPVQIVRAYIYDSGAIRAEPCGPSGPIGAPGIAGLPADVFALEGTQGQKLLEQMARQLGVPVLERTVNTLIERATRLAATNTSVHPLLRLLTPEWKARYEQMRESGRKAALAAPLKTGTLCPAGAMGPPGPHGARGMDGQLPAVAVTTRLSAARVQQLIDILKQDKSLTQRIQRVQQQIEEAGKVILHAEQ